jgi:hypothetical protein
VAEGERTEPPHKSSYRGEDGDLVVHGFLVDPAGEPWWILILGALVASALKTLRLWLTQRTHERNVDRVCRCLEWHARFGTIVDTAAALRAIRPSTGNRHPTGAARVPLVTSKTKSDR